MPRTIVLNREQAAKLEYEIQAELKRYGAEMCWQIDPPKPGIYVQVEETSPLFAQPKQFVISVVIIPNEATLIPEGFKFNRTLNNWHRDFTLPRLAIQAALDAQAETGVPLVAVQAH